jgi:hypothetical protein
MENEAFPRLLTLKEEGKLIKTNNTNYFINKLTILHVNL